MAIKMKKRSSQVPTSSGCWCSSNGILLWSCLSLLLFNSLLVGTQTGIKQEQQHKDLTILGDCTYDDRECSTLSALNLQGHISFLPSHACAAEHDFGNMLPRPSCHDERPSSSTSKSPSRVGAVLFPASVADISTLVKHAYFSNISISARGVGHSFHGQARPFAPPPCFPASTSSSSSSSSSTAADSSHKLGMVVEMSRLKGIRVFGGGFGEAPYVDASAGELWADVIKACIARGLAPRSFTDYLHLTVGGTLSNAGISGQTFRYGPQISNVIQLEVVTGTGDVVTCSPTQNADLFFAVLGGLGQFGIITRARVVLEKAPPKVRWIRALYSDFAAFTRDQEYLISQPKDSSFDYIEGSVLVNKLSSPNGYSSVPFPGQVLNESLIPDSAGPMLYCLELTKMIHQDETTNLIDKEVASLLAPLSYIPSLVFTSDVPYFDFLNRVQDGEMKLRQQGLWQAEHPWMNLFIPRSGIAQFDAYVFRQLFQNGINGPLLFYPMDRAKWDPRMSAVTPDEDVFYTVGLLRYITPVVLEQDASERAIAVNSLLQENQDVLSFCRQAGIAFKQYLPWYTTQAEWKQHFGTSKWNTMVRRKSLYDPLAILSTGQKIFTTRPSSSSSSTCSGHF